MIEYRTDIVLLYTQFNLEKMISITICLVIVAQQIQILLVSSDDLDVYIFLKMECSAIQLGRSRMYLRRPSIFNMITITLQALNIYVVIKVKWLAEVLGDK